MEINMCVLTKIKELELVLLLNTKQLKKKKMQQQIPYNPKFHRFYDIFVSCKF